MSLEAYIWAANLPLSSCNGTAFRVLLQLADRVDPLGYGAWPSVASMAETLECSERTVQRALRDLLNADLIRVSNEQRYVDHIRLDRRPVVYDLMTPALRMTESRGDNCVTPDESRGDKNGPHGVTTVVAHRTVLNPPTKTSQSIPTFSTAHESGMNR